MITSDRGYMTFNNAMIPEGAKYLIYILTKYGRFQAYLVGGCVRDMCMNRIPHDWDITTNATPNEMISIIETICKRDERNIQIVPTGLKHGTVTFVLDGEGYEITTFRNDGEYSDNRRPDKVTFTNNLLEDLSRRDFTINTITYNQYIGFQDFYDGIKDIRNKVICCVGNPQERFKEDGLRILRAIRFAAQLKFMIEENTSQAIHSERELLDNISQERISQELSKILMSENCGNEVLREYADVICQVIPEIKPMIGFKQNNPYHLYDVWEHTLHCMDDVTSDTDLITRLAIFLHDIGKPNNYVEDENGIGHFYGHAHSSYAIAQEVLKRLRYSNDIVESVSQLIDCHDVTLTPTKAAVKRLLNKLGEKQLRRLLVLRTHDIKGQSSKDIELRLEKVYKVSEILDWIVEQSECFQLKDLAINGRDLIEIGIPEGKLIGKILNLCLAYVIDGTVDNTREELFKVANMLFTANPTLYTGGQTND